MKEGRKRIFIGLLTVSCLILCLALFLALILPWLIQDVQAIHYISITFGILAIAAICGMGVSLVFHIQTGKNLPGILHIRHLLIRVLLPLMEVIGKGAGVKKDTVRRSFIKVNNEFVLANFKVSKPEKILLLLPHCIQASKCARRLNATLENCADCGGCQAGYLQKLSQKYGFKVAIATGGTIARRIVKECRPECIIAVACERDLTSGIQDAYPIPVFGVLNLRPQGPCKDTLVPQTQLNSVLAYFLGLETIDGTREADGQILCKNNNLNNNANQRL